MMENITKLTENDLLDIIRRVIDILSPVIGKNEELKKKEDACEEKPESGLFSNGETDEYTEVKYNGKGGDGIMGNKETGECVNGDPYTKKLGDKEEKDGDTRNDGWGDAFDKITNDDVKKLLNNNGKNSE